MSSYCARCRLRFASWWTAATAALILWHEGQLTTHVVDSEGCCAGHRSFRYRWVAICNWPEAVWQAISEQEKASRSSRA